MEKHPFKALVVAVPKYDFWDALPTASSSAAELAKGLALNGYVIDDEHKDLLQGGKLDWLSNAVTRWLDRSGMSDTLFLYWTGHGHREGSLYLVAENSPRTGLTGFKAIAAEELGKAIAYSKAEKILVILDTCYSEQGANEVADGFAAVMAARARVPGHQRAVAVIASAHPLELAQEGIFCEALRQVLFNGPKNRSWSDEDKFIHSSDLASAIGAKLAPYDVEPGYKADGYNQRFIPNPRYRSGLAAEDVETRRWRERLSDHFHYASRGIEVGETGWFFAGRQRLLADIVRWLATAENGLRIVTGLPGSGKSAVLGRLATLSDPSYRTLAEQQNILAQVAANTLPPVGAFDVAVHAKGKPFDDCIRALASGLGIGIEEQFDLTLDVKSLIEAVRLLNRRITLLIDALDEAQPGHALPIARDLIVPLSGLPNVRVLLGTRRSLDGTAQPEDQRHTQLCAVFGKGAIIDDLADETATAQDIADFVSLRLKTHSQHAPDAIAAVAARVAEKAGESFLYARVISRTLQAADTLEIELPNDALDAFALDIQTRFGEEAGRVHCLLAALAWGLGKGLTRRVWPKVAEAASAAPEKFTDDDISWGLSKAGWHIIETGEEGQAVYRLAHQAFADYYRELARKAGLDVVEANRRIALSLAEGYSGSDWLDADGYVHKYLSTHAMRGKVLDDLIIDPAFLATADPARLLPNLGKLATDRARRIADVYSRRAHLLPDLDPSERMAYTHLTACMEDPATVPSMEPVIPGSWRCCWARVMPTSPHRVISQHNGAVRTVAFGEIDGRLVIISGGDDGIILIREARSGAAFMPPLVGHNGAICAVAVGLIGGRTVLASAGTDKTIKLWDLRNGIMRTQLQQFNEIRTLNLCEIDSQPIIVSGGREGICIWKCDGCKPENFIKDIQLVAVHAIPQEPSKPNLAYVPPPMPIVGDYFHDDQYDHQDYENMKKNYELESTYRYELQAYRNAKECFLNIVKKNDATVCIWDARSNEVLDKPNSWIPSYVKELQVSAAGYRCVPQNISAVALKAIGGRQTIISGAADGTIQLWDKRDGTPLAPALTGHDGPIAALAADSLGDRDVIVSGGRDGTIRVWDGRDREAITVIRDKSPVNAVAIGSLDDQQIIVSGGQEGTIQLWDAYSGRHLSTPLKGHEQDVFAVAIGQVEGRPAIISGSKDKRVLLWDARSSQRFVQPLERHEGGVETLSLGHIDDKKLIATGGKDKTIRLWDFATGSAVRSPIQGHDYAVRSVSIEECGGRSLILSCDKKKARVWDADSGTQLRVLETWLSRIFGGSNLHAAAIGKLGDRTVVAPIRSSGAIRLWDAHTGKKIVKLPVKNASTIAFGRFGDSPIIVCGSSELQLFDGCSLRLIAKLAQTGLIKALAVEEIDGQQTIIFGNQENEIRLWDGVSGKPHLTIATAHSDSLTGITCGVINGRSVILSGSRDGTVRVWDLRNAQLLKTISLEQPVNAIQCDERGRVAAATDRGVLVLLLASFDGLTEVSVDDREEAKASVNG